MKKNMLLLVLIIVWVLVGCNTRDEDMEIKKVTKDFLLGYQDLDEKIGQYLVGYDNDDIIKYNGFQAILARKMTFKIGKIEYIDNTYLVNLKINNVDFQVAFEEVLEELTIDDTEDDVIKKLSDRLEADFAKRKEFELSIPVQQVNDTYKIVLTSELSNALLGGYNEYLTTLTGGTSND